MNEELESMTEAEQLAVYAEDVALAEAMVRLQKNPDFIKVFNEKFVKDFALTQQYNLAVFDPQTRGRVYEGMTARSHFQRFQDEIIEEGNKALNDKADLESMKKLDAEEE